MTSVVIPHTSREKLSGTLTVNFDTGIVFLQCFSLEIARSMAWVTRVATTTACETVALPDISIFIRGV